MTIDDYKQTLHNPLCPRAICFLVRGGEVLLGKKKEGFGKGNWVGIGGKIESGETIEQGLARELQEEIGVMSTNFKKIAVIDFYFPHRSDESWNQQVHAFTANSWEGKPKETNEILPQWFSKDALPFDSMWADARHWLPVALSGRDLSADFLFDDTFEILDKSIRESACSSLKPVRIVSELKPGFNSANPVAIRHDFFYL